MTKSQPSPHQFSFNPNFILDEAEAKLKSDCQVLDLACQSMKDAIAEVLKGDSLTEKQRQYALTLQKLAQ